MDKHSKNCKCPVYGCQKLIKWCGSVGIVDNKSEGSYILALVFSAGNNLQRVGNCSGWLGLTSDTERVQPHPQTQPQLHFQSQAFVTIQLCVWEIVIV